MTAYTAVGVGNVRPSHNIGQGGQFPSCPSRIIIIIPFGMRGSANIISVCTFSYLPTFKNTSRAFSQLSCNQFLMRGLPRVFLV